MGFVRFSENGYEYLDTSYNVQFAENKCHFHLFDYVASDLSKLPELMEGYISEIMDPVTLKLRSDSGDSSRICEIQKLLKASHPYYSCEGDKAIFEEIGTFFNRLLVYTGFDRSRYQTKHVFQKRWYQKRISALIPKSLLSSGEYPPGYSPEELYIKYHNWVCPPFVDPQIEEYLTCGVPRKRPIPFSDELYTHSFISNILYLILDSSVQGMDKLSIQQRYWLFGNIFRYSNSNLGATRRFFFFQPASFRDNHDRSDEVEYLCALDDLFRPLRKLSGLNIGRDGIEESMNGVFAAAIDRAKQETNAKIYEEYKIDNLQQLLYLEIMAMIHAGVTIRKCKNCSRYFVPENRKRVYCDRIDNLGQRCADVGQKASFRKKVEQEPALAAYNRAYKTHYKRRQDKKMSPTDFEKWCREAKEKLGQVRADKLNFSDFQTWLRQ